MVQRPREVKLDLKGQDIKKEIGVLVSHRQISLAESQNSAL